MEKKSKVQDSTPIPIAKRPRRKTKWRYTEEEQLLLGAFFKVLWEDADRAVERAKSMAKIEANDYTINTLKYWQNVKAAMEWAVVRITQKHAHEKIPTVE